MLLGHFIVLFIFTAGLMGGPYLGASYLELFGIGDFDYLFSCKRKLVPVRKQNSEIGKFPANEVFPCFRGKEKGTYGIVDGRKLGHTGSRNSRAGNLPISKKPGLELNLDLGEFCRIDIPNDGKSSHCKFAFYKPAGVFSRFVDAVRQGRHVEFPCDVVSADGVYHGCNLDGSGVEITIDNCWERKHGNQGNEQQEENCRCGVNCPVQVEEADAECNSEQGSGCDDKRQTDQRAAELCFRGIVEPVSKQVPWRNVLLDILFLPARFLSLSFWTIRFTWHLGLLHKLFVYLFPLSFFLYEVRAKWQECPYGLKPHGYGYSTSWLELSNAWQHFWATGHIEGLLNTVLLFLILLGGVEFFLPALSATIVRVTGRRVLSPLTYFNWLEFCFVWLPALASYALASYFAAALVREFASGSASAVVWLFGYVLFTSPWFAFRECRWHGGLWWHYLKA